MLTSTLSFLSNIDNKFLESVYCCWYLIAINKRNICKHLSFLGGSVILPPLWRAALLNIKFWNILDHFRLNWYILKYNGKVESSIYLLHIYMHICQYLLLRLQYILYFWRLRCPFRKSAQYFPMQWMSVPAFLNQRRFCKYLELDKQAKVNKMSYYYSYDFVNIISFQ